jgi:glycosyltransferase involved in cell wall biosynthesis
MGLPNNNNNSNKNTNILYIFNEGRTKRLNSNNSFPKEFFYYFTFIENDFKNTDFIEMNPVNPSFISRIVYFFEKILRKFTNLPFYFFQIISFENLRKIFNSNLIILTNETVGFSTLFILSLLRIFKKNVSSVIFIMGFFNNFIDENKNRKFKKIILCRFIKTFDNLIFLGKKEYNYAKTNFLTYNHKFSYIPFAVDLDYWKSDKIELIDNKQILFIGNDQNRDFIMLLNIANSLPEYNFLFITNNKINNLPTNVTILEGSWRTLTISDDKIRKIYNESWLTIIPLKESIQPSGQSVALQSMSMNVPVMITLTEGFWDTESFQDGENIYFIQNGIQGWVNKIKEIEKSKELTKISKSALESVSNNYDLEQNYEKFYKLVCKILKI